VGKSTVLGAILERRPQLRYSVSYTTRPRRTNEQDGVHYHFISESAFRKKIEDDEFVEWAEVHGHLYGTSAPDMERILADGKDMLLDIDVQGAKNVSARYSEAVLVFMAPPSVEELERRIRERRADSSGAISRRLKDAEDEMAQTHLYDHVLINDDLAQTVSELEGIIERVGARG
jgi:guanylate kinase